MKLCEIFEPVLAPWSDFIGKPIKLLNIYDKKNRDIGRTSRATAQTVVVKNTHTKQIVGNRTIYQKDSSSAKVKIPYDDPKYSSISK